MTLAVKRLENFAGVVTVFFAVGAVILVMIDEKALKIAHVRFAHAVNERLRADAFLLRTQHDGRAVGVVGANVVAFVAAHALEAHPDIRLNVFDQMPEVNIAVGIRQGAGDENSPYVRHDES